MAGSRERKKAKSVVITQEAPMAGNKPITFGPVTIPASLTTLIAAPEDVVSGEVGFTAGAGYVIVRHIRIVNKTGSAATYTLYKGLDGVGAAGTEFMGAGASVAANDSVDWYGYLRLDGDPYGHVVGIASAATTLVLTGEGEVGWV